MIAETDWQAHKERYHNFGGDMPLSEIYRRAAYMMIFAHTHEGHGWPQSMRHAQGGKYSAILDDMLERGHIIIDIDSGGYVMTPAGIAHWRAIVKAFSDARYDKRRFDCVVKHYDKNGYRVEAE